MTNRAASRRNRQQQPASLRYNAERRKKLPLTWMSRVRRISFPRPKRTSSADQANSPESACRPCEARRKSAASVDHTGAVAELAPRRRCGVPRCYAARDVLGGLDFEVAGELTGAFSAPPAAPKKSSPRHLLSYWTQHATDGADHAVPAARLHTQLLSAGRSKTVVASLAVVYRTCPKRKRSRRDLPDDAAPDTRSRALPEERLPTLFDHMRDGVTTCGPGQQGL